MRLPWIRLPVALLPMTEMPKPLVLPLMTLPGPSPATDVSPPMVVL